MTEWVGRYIGRIFEFVSVVPLSHTLGLNIKIRDISQALSDVSLSFLFTLRGFKAKWYFWFSTTSLTTR